MNINQIKLLTQQKPIRITKLLDSIDHNEFKLQCKKKKLTVPQPNCLGADSNNMELAVAHKNPLPPFKSYQ